MKVAVIGTGYVGLVSGVCLAAKGHAVTCVDVRPEVVAQLNAGQPTIHERGLPELLGEVIAAGRFQASHDLAAAVAAADLVLIAVGTPSVDGRIDLTAVRAAAEQIGAVLRGVERFVAVVVKSTVVPGTTDTVVRAVLERAAGKKLGAFGLGMNPEFLREGAAIEDFMAPDRIVFGHEDPRTLALLEELYRPWTGDKLAVNTRTAEMIKYANNCLLATQISAVNELANLCFELGGIDVRDVMQGVHLDQRWSPITPGGRIHPQILTYLIPGCGFGGSCFPKDVQALRTLGQDRGLPMHALQAVLEINDAQPLQIIRQLESALGDLRGRSILILGLAFKPGTDDLRESASLRIIDHLVACGAHVSAHDPIALENAKRYYADQPVSFVEDWPAAVPAAEAVVVATAWRDYASLPTLHPRVFADARRMFQPGDFPETVYLAIGLRPASAP